MYDLLDVMKECVSEEEQRKQFDEFVKNIPSIGAGFEKMDSTIKQIAWVAYSQGCMNTSKKVLKSIGALVA